MPRTTRLPQKGGFGIGTSRRTPCLLYTSDAADERSSVDLGGRRIIKKKTEVARERLTNITYTELDTADVVTHR